MNSLFNIANRVIIVTGATGKLAGSAADYLASQGARVVYLGRKRDRLEMALARCRQQTPEAQCLAAIGDVLDRQSLERVRDEVLAKWGRIDALINGAGGHVPAANIPQDKSFADLDFAAFQEVVNLNLNGTVLPSLVFVPELMKGGGAVVNYSSVSSTQAVTRAVGYSAAKSAVDNFTRWLAMDMARRTGGKVRVNAIMPGFFVAEQNRRLLLNEDGSLTERGKLILQNTPFGRFGKADELHGAIHFLVSEASQFVTGIVMAVDGGFSIYSGV